MTLDCSIVVQWRALYPPQVAKSITSLIRCGEFYVLQLRGDYPHSSACCPATKGTKAAIRRLQLPELLFHPMGYVTAYAVAIVSLLAGAAVVHNVFSPDLVRP